MFGLILALQGAFAFWLLTMLFYRAGAYFLDAGFYVYAIASDRAPNNPPLVRQAWGDTVFLTHTTISPMAIMALLRPIFGVPLNFIMYLVMQHVTLAAAGGLISIVAASLFRLSHKQIVLAGATGAILLPLSNIGMGSLAYPHVEIFGSSAIAVGICLFVLKWTGFENVWVVPVAVLLIIVGMLAREDLGGHIAIAVVAATVCSPFRSWKKSTWSRAVILAAVGGTTTIGLLLFQRVVLGSDGAFDISYSGTPAYAHVTSVWYLLERFLYLIGSRLDLTIATTAFIIGGLVTKNRALFAFPIALFPWIILNATSVDPSKNSLGIYGMFPVVIYLTAPLITMSIDGVTTESEPTGDSVPTHSTAVSGHFIYLIAIVSLFLGGISGGPNGGGYVYYSLLRYPIIGPGEISLTNTLVKDFAREGNRIAVDDAVMTLNPVEHEETPLISKVTDTSQIDSILFFPAFILGEAQVTNFFQSWIDQGRVVSMKCLPGGLVRADAAGGQASKPQTSRGQFNKALRCHPRPAL
jgi:hypothetical protein